MEPYHYKEVGLPNVYLFNISIVQDVDGEKVIYIPNINQLHDLIARTILSKRGSINGSEIRFLRTHACMLQADLAKLIGKDSQTIGRWERGDNPIDNSMDILVRLAIANALNVEIDISIISQLSIIKIANDNINIDGADNQYKLMAA